MIFDLTWAKEQLKVTDALHDTDILTSLAEAEGVIAEYLGPDFDPTWTAGTIPKSAQVTVSWWLTFLYEYRGNERRTEDATTRSEQLWVDTRLTLGRLHTQALA